MRKSEETTRGLDTKGETDYAAAVTGREVGGAIREDDTVTLVASGCGRRAGRLFCSCTRY